MVKLAFCAVMGFSYLLGAINPTVMLTAVTASRLAKKKAALAHPSPSPSPSAWPSAPPQQEP